jgi:hypothetical protein
MFEGQSRAGGQIPSDRHDSYAVIVSVVLCCTIEARIFDGVLALSLSWENLDLIGSLRISA